jgi:hypothetical protein
MASRKYKYANIRELLVQGFNEEELRNLCYEEPEFKTVYDNWPRGTPKSTFVQEFIDLADRRLKLDTLLDLAKKHNSARYEAHQPYYEDDEPASQSAASTSSVEVPETAPAGNDIFISYSRRDLEFVKKLYNYLTQQGISAWFDQTSIEIGDQWRETIVNGIMGCKIFLVVLSPDSAASKNVRKEIDLAERNTKKIVPLIWRGDGDEVIPPAIAYQLAGINYFNFKETASEENLNKIVNVIAKLLGGVPIAEAAAGEAVVETKGVSAQPAQPAETSSGRPNRLGGGSRLQKKQEVSASMTGGTVIARVVTPLALNVEAQDIVNKELQWLFTAADHFLRIRQAGLDRASPVPVDIPDGSEKSPQANNAVLASVDDFSLQMIEGQIESIIKQINIYLKNLTFELDKEAQLGGAAASNIALMNSIKSQRKAIVERTQELASLMRQVYGVMVYSPDELAQFLT